MIEQSAFTFSSDDGVDLFASKWIKGEQQKPRALVQIAHGMAEYIMRYDSFAKELAAQNIFVYGNDHRGHGETAKLANSYGYFSDENGFEKVLQDMRTLTTIMEKEYPDVPIFLFGHSMGSFLSRRYIQLFGDKLSGVVLCGTGGNPGIIGKVGAMIASREKKRKGSTVPSPLLNKLTFGNFNKAFRPNRTEFDWLSRDEKQVDKYIEDSMCGGVFSSGFFFDFLNGLGTVHKKQNVSSVPLDLPIFLISGSRDPVGGKSGKGVLQTFKSFKQIGSKDVRYKLYKEARHELLNEINKDEVQMDIINWINDHLRSSGSIKTL
ncbi:alpha/beta hydrolase [Domibacillus robiginosus]|uniref:alpha/beta hydrolase n=1 Tax=Domibacillus robiginosus TaxID=1071054 RepID=UPI000AD51970|nr:alpha/beta hydrolase [Domibacillus robiginosus]